MHAPAPAWFVDWLGIVLPVVQVLAVLAGAWLVVRLLEAVLARVARRYDTPELMVGIRRVLAVLIYAAALLLVLERLGVSGQVLWTTLTGFAAVGAVAFFAAWSVLSNIFCSFLIFATRPFRLHDRVEIIDAPDKPGICGRVVDINFIYTTLQDLREPHAGTVLQVPNALFFQRTTRRWPDG